MVGQILNRKFTKRLFLFAWAASLLFSQASVYASIFYERNDILYYHPDATESVCNTTLDVTGSNNVEIVLKVLTSAGMSIAQAAGVAGNLVVESGDQNINPAAEEFPGEDRGGKGVVQWTAARWRGQDGLRAFAEHKGTPWQDMNTQMEFILWEVGKGAAWDGKPGGAERRGWEATLNETTPAAAAETWMLRYERPGVPHLDRRISAAERIFSEYGSADLGNVTIGSANCGAGAVNGDIAATAKNLAWPHRVSIERGEGARHGESAAKPEYVKAVEQFHTAINQAMFTDCGVFVSTVMRSSGVDPDYPLRGTSVQLPYLRNSPKYKTFVAASESELLPGDILIRDGHTYIYVGPYTAPKDNQQYKAVGASWFTRPPSGHTLYLSGSNSSDISSSDPFTIARYIGE
ncbi:hypothetical protein B7Y94_04670 [Candidatus Saccharibacteria bacterium 32-49-12]|nr:MAG: hypothetical protein B7Y94_04670 [Candidatus Saccharibacteria bacterium 32-49-12]